MPADSVLDYRITLHSTLEMEWRRIPEVTVRRVLPAPEQRADFEPGRVVFESQMRLGEPSSMVSAPRFRGRGPEPCEGRDRLPEEQDQKSWEG